MSGKNMKTAFLIASYLLRHSMKSMGRHLATAPAAFVVTSCLAACTTNAFVFTAPFHKLVLLPSSPRERTKSVADFSCVANGPPCRRSGEVSGWANPSDNDNDSAIAPSSSLRLKRTWAAATRLGGARNDGQWEPLTPSLVRAAHMLMLFSKRLLTSHSVDNQSVFTCIQLTVQSLPSV